MQTTETLEVPVHKAILLVERFRDSNSQAHAHLAHAIDLSIGFAYAANESTVRLMGDALDEYNFYNSAGLL